ncbi:hypothetical protein LWI28_002961 [Acer negundo]|uniref:Uncharacterized protein n=1 Tax=Acer negundo TaxID=4023 RepID=A0AAD5NTL1_ACENE|nr:hypothetical protein LWI28_002961 [Acer negundo]
MNGLHMLGGILIPSNDDIDRFPRQFAQLNPFAEDMGDRGNQYPGVDGLFKDEDLADWDWGDQIEEIEDGSELAEEEIEDLQVSMVIVAKNPPPKLELKELPTTLKYVYLGENETYPVIVASELKNNEEKRLMKVLQKHKGGATAGNANGGNRGNRFANLEVSNSDRSPMEDSSSPFFL